MPKPKLLLADDSITIQKVVNLTFADQGMDVVTFSDGDAAIENFDTVKPDIVLADVHMPGINGYQLCELLRSDAASSEIPIVLLVGSFEPFDREEAERVGASGYLTKPFTSIAELVSTVENLLTEPSPAEPETESAEGDERPGPDTRDIDSLYEQSFAETVEIPKDEAEELEFGEIGLDDEMIQTSYGEPEPAPDLEGSLYVDEVGANEGTQEFHPPEAGSQIDHSISEERPVAEEPHFDTVPEREGEIEEFAPAETTGTAPQEVNVEGSVEEELQEVEFAEPIDEGRQAKALPGPFDSIAAELPPIRERRPTAFALSGSSELDDTDLLELPGAPQIARGAGVENNPALDDMGRITALSPELIDLIVDKVVARLEERTRTSGE